MKTPTKQQQEIIEAKGNTVITAKPGSGKTFVVVNKIAFVLECLPNHKGVIAISYTNKASDEIKDRCKKMGIDLKSSFFGTIDAFYISEIIIPFSSHLIGKVIEFEVHKLDEYPKYSDLKKFGINPSVEQEKLLVQSLNEGLIFLDIDGETALFILRNVDGIKKYIKSRYVEIIIDEYQDCGLIQDKVFRYLISLGLIGTAVGDLDQAIFAFAKRYPKYLKNLLAEKHFVHYELTRNFRCHTSISDYSIAFLSNPFSFTPAEDKRVFERYIENGSEADVAYYIDSSIDSTINYFNEKCNKTIKRNNVVLLVTTNKSAKLYHDCLNTPSKYYIETPLDRSQSNCDRLFMDILNHCFSDNSSAVDFAENYFLEDTDRKKYKETLHLMQHLLDLPNKVKTLINHINIFEKLAETVLSSKSIDTSKLKETLTNNEYMESFIPPKDNELLIMTIYKSKGLEFEIVYHLDLYEYVFPKISYDLTEDDIHQQECAHYVALTRAIEACFLMHSGFRTYSNGEIKKATPSSYLTKEGLSCLRNSKKTFKDR